MAAKTNANKRTVVHKSSTGILTAFPDVCKTPTPAGPIPIPYPNIAMSSDTDKGSKDVKMDGNPVMLKDSKFSKSTGDEPGSAGGVVSGCIKGEAIFINYSFDVKVEGKNVPRLGDMMITNKKNTPPMPEIQPPLIVLSSVGKDDVQKCEYCNKEIHGFSNKGGSSIGSGQRLRSNIIKDIKNHTWYAGAGSLQAHHLICSESMDDDDWYEYCRLFGYDINHKNNGVMLPYELQLACQLHVPLHRGNHSAGTGGSVSYPDAIKDELKKIKDQIKSGDFCSEPKALVKKLNNLSVLILGKIDKFRWTITCDGKDYKEGGNGCSNTTDSISDKPNEACKCDRKHSLMNKKIISKKSQPLSIGK